MTRSSVPWKRARTLPSADSTVEDWAAGRAAGSGTLPTNRAKTATAPAAKPAAAQSHHRRKSQMMIRPPSVLGCARRRCRCRGVGAGACGDLVLPCDPLGAVEVVALGLAAPDPPPRAAGDLVWLAGLPPAGPLAVVLARLARTGDLAASRAGVLAGAGAGLRPPDAGPPALAAAAGLRRGGSERDCRATGMNRLLRSRSSGLLGGGPRRHGACGETHANLQEVGPQPGDGQFPHRTEGNDQEGGPDPQPAKLR